MVINPVFIKIISVSDNYKGKNLEPEKYLFEENFYYKTIIINWERKSIHAQNQFKRIGIVSRTDYLIRINGLIFNANKNFTILTIKKLYAYKRSLDRDK
jgi:hypothetical protein